MRFGLKLGGSACLLQSDVDCVSAVVRCTRGLASHHHSTPMHSPQRHILTGCLQEVDLSFGCNTQPRLKFPAIYFLQALHEYSMYGQALALCYAIKPESVSACLTACVLLIISIIF